MRSLLASHLVLVALPIAAQTCGNTGTGIPTITGLEFPAEIRGDSSLNEGEFTFIDSDAGVRYAYLDVVTCPADFTCPQLDTDLWEANPDFGEATGGTIGFTLSCTNPNADAPVVTYAWSLEDIDGNLGEAWLFSFKCQGTGSGVAGRGAVTIAF